MGETMLNMKTPRFSLQQRCQPSVLQKYTALKVTGYSLLCVGAGLIITNIALDNRGFHPVGLAGYHHCVLPQVFQLMASFDSSL